MNQPGEAHPRQAALVVSSTSGRLGNQLMLHAHVLAFAIDSGCAAWFPTLHRHGPAFEGPSRSLVTGRSWMGGLQRLAPRSTAAWFLRRFGNLVAKRRWDNRILGSVTAAFDLPVEDLLMDSPAFRERIARHRVLFMLGFRFRAYACLIRHADAVRAYFLPVQAIRDTIDAVEAAGRRLAPVLVGVHVRQGDYAEFLGGRHYHSIADYARKMRRIEQLLAPRPVAFLVVAEGPLDEAAFAGLRVVRGPGTAVGDMYSLARCDYTFGVPSTFSRWGAFHGNVPHWTMEDAASEPALDKFKVQPVPVDYPLPAAARPFAGE